MRGLGSGHVTSGPMRGLEKTAPDGTNRQTNRQTNKHTDKHGDSMTESAQWADSVKIQSISQLIILVLPSLCPQVLFVLVFNKCFKCEKKIKKNKLCLLANICKKKI